MKWQPIETAPKDKRILLARVAVAKYGLCGVADGYYNERGVLVWPYKKEPTHWMPMPEAPGG